MSIMQFLFSFNGRVRRLHFWLFLLALSTVYGGLFWQFGHWHIEHRALSTEVFGVMTNPIFVLLAIPACWAKLAVFVKRWHDRDKSGWFVLVYLIPVIGWLWQFIECGFLDGTPGPNRFGPSPKAQAPAAATAAAF
jgi:uncharacterized membrane protein YhaH (DUF805 family)